MVGVDRVVAVDLHCGKIQYFGVNTPRDVLGGSVVALPYFASAVLKLDPARTTGYRSTRRRARGSRRGSTREAVNQGSQMDLVGDVDGCNCIIVETT